MKTGKRGFGAGQAKVQAGQIGNAQIYDYHLAAELRRAGRCLTHRIVAADFESSPSTLLALLTEHDVIPVIMISCITLFDDGQISVSVGENVLVAPEDVTLFRAEEWELHPGLRGIATEPGERPLVLSYIGHPTGGEAMLCVYLLSNVNV